MMFIRCEDKELIHNLAILGALFGACVSVFLTVHLSNRAREKNAQHSEYQQTNAALAKLSSSTTGPETAVVDKDILKQVQEHIQQEQPAEAPESAKSFWLDLPKWGFWSICAGSGIAGAVAGFSTIWASGWAGSVLLYSFIRLMYKVIRKVAPNSAAAKLSEQGQMQQPDHPNFERNQQRIFPTLVKLMFLLLMALAALAVVVWKVTGL